MNKTEYLTGYRPQRVPEADIMLIPCVHLGNCKWINSTFFLLGDIKSSTAGTLQLFQDLYIIKMLLLAVPYLHFIYPTGFLRLQISGAHTKSVCLVAQSTSNSEANGCMKTIQHILANTCDKKDPYSSNTQSDSGTSFNGLERSSPI